MTASYTLISLGNTQCYSSFSETYKLALWTFCVASNADELKIVANQINSNTISNLSRVHWIKISVTENYFLFIPEFEQCENANKKIFQLRTNWPLANRFRADLLLNKFERSEIGETGAREGGVPMWISSNRSGGPQVNKLEHAKMVCKETIRWIPAC